jgi:IclR family transcriptional regulator, KDG regulon repressor
LAATARRGYSLDREEFMLGLSAIAVPVRDRHSVVQAALACHGPTARFNLDNAEQHLDVLSKAAEKLSRTLPE